jgi:hypothetical protein
MNTEGHKPPSGTAQSISVMNFHAPTTTNPSKQNNQQPIINPHQTQTISRHIDQDNRDSLRLNLVHNLVDYVVVWVDAHLNLPHSSCPDCLIMLDDLKTVTSSVETFKSINDCFLYLNFDSNMETKVFLCLSGQIGKEYACSLREHDRIEKIYIYCWKSDNYVSLMNDFAVYSNKEQILTRLSNDIKQYASRWSFDNQCSVQGASPHASESFSSWYDLFYTLLPILARGELDRNEMIEECLQYYKGNLTMKAKIKSFAEEYKPERAVWYYTTFAYEIVNAALRSENTKVILKFRAYLYDLFEQLFTLYYNQKLERINNMNLPKNWATEEIDVYRGQFISNDELIYLKENLRKTIRINAFTSASHESGVAERWIAGCKQVHQKAPLLLTINIDSLFRTHNFFRNYNKYPPVADITALSQYEDECEVLFAFGSIFKVLEVKEPDEKHSYAVVRLSLITETNEQYVDQRRVKLFASVPGFKASYLLDVLNLVDKYKPVIPWKSNWQSYTCIDKIKPLSALLYSVVADYYTYRNSSVAVDIYKRAILQESAAPLIEYSRNGFFHFIKTAGSSVSIINFSSHLTMLN